MGLDITAYSHMVKSTINPTTDDELEEAWERDARRANWDLAFDRSGLGLERGAWYEPTDKTETHDFRAGSYSGYNNWRETLAEHVGLTVADYWGKSDTGQPFYELVNFSDCDGTIGPEAARELLGDFRWHEASYMSAFDTYDREKYADWKTAFELASRDGMVVFH